MQQWYNCCIVPSSNGLKINNREHVAFSSNFYVSSAFFNVPKKAKLNSSCLLNPLSANIHRQILQTDLYIFP